MDDQGGSLPKKYTKIAKILRLSRIKKHVWQQENFIRKRNENACKRHAADINFDEKRTQIIRTQVSQVQLLQGTRRRGDKVARRQEINFLIVKKLTIIVCIVFLVNLSTGPLSTKKLILINLKH